MEARKLQTTADLLASPEERVELIDGEIVRRPMARAEHGVVQGNTREELGPFNRKSGPGGWWILTEVSVAYELHQCPSHDLAGWRKERMPERPSGVIELAPDWVCEIVSPGHERKDTLTLFLLLQRHRVPFYWLIWPEDRTWSPGPGRRPLSGDRHPVRARPGQGPALRRDRDRPRLHPRRLKAPADRRDSGGFRFVGMLDHVADAYGSLAI